MKNNSSFTLVGLHFAATKEEVGVDAIGTGQWGNNVADEGEQRAVLPGLSRGANIPFSSPWEQRFLYIKALPKIGMPVVSEKPYPIKAGHSYKFSFDGKKFRQSHDH